MKSNKIISTILLLLMSNSAVQALKLKVENKLSQNIYVADDIATGFNQKDDIFQVRITSLYSVGMMKETFLLRDAPICIEIKENETKEIELSSYHTHLISFAYYSNEITKFHTPKAWMITNKKNINCTLMNNQYSKFKWFPNFIGEDKYIYFELDDDNFLIHEKVALHIDHIPNQF